MKTIYFGILRYFRQPSVRKSSNQLLEQARRDLLKHQNLVDYYETMVVYNQKTIDRLSK